MKYLLTLLFLPSCVTIYVTEKPKLASHIPDDHHCGKAIYKDAPKFTTTPYFLPSTGSCNAGPAIIETPDWLKLCDTCTSFGNPTFKN